LIATDHNGRKVIERSVHQDELPDYIGKDVAAKLLEADPRYSTAGGTAHNIRELSGIFSVRLEANARRRCHHIQRPQARCAARPL
jgi:hypothetical protein